MGNRAVLLIVTITLSLPACTSDNGTQVTREPARPEADVQLDPSLLRIIEPQIEIIEANKGSGKAHGTLGTMYEANEAWGLAQRAYENAAAVEPSFPEWLYHAALAQQALGDSAGAAQKFQWIAERFPEFAPGRHSYGLARLEAGDIEAAERELTKVQQLKSSLSEANAALAQLRNLQGRFPEALELAEKAVALAPRSSRARFVRGTALRGLKRFDEASPDLRAGSGATPGVIPDALTMSIGRYITGLTLQVDRGADLIELGRYDDAISVLVSALGDHPDDVSLQTNLSVAYLRKGEFDSATEVLTKLLEADPDHLPTLLNLSEALWAQRDLEKGLQVSNHAVEKHPTSGLAHFARTRNLFAQERIQEGLAAIEEAILHDPLNAEIQSAAGEGHLRLNQLEQAEKYFRRSVELNAIPLPPRANLCAVLIRRHRWKEAEEGILQLSREAPDHPRIRALQQRFAEARAGRTTTPGGN